MKRFIVGAVALLSVALFLSSDSVQGGGKDKAKFTISEVMKEAMKGGLCGKVAKGDASKEDRERLAELFTALAQNKPPKGEEDAWKEKAGALAAAAKKAVGDAEAGKALGKLVNCGACHKEFKK